MAVTVREKIWQGTIGGLVGGLAEARRLKAKGRRAAALISRASTYYSYGLVPLARRCVDETAWWFHLDVLTDGQCNVVGTILLRRFLWIKPDQLTARYFLKAGLTKNPPSDSEALLHIGLAEAEAMVGNSRRSQTEEEVAVGLWLRAIPIEEGCDKATFEERSIQSGRQFSRVFRRAMVLAWNRGDKPTARSHYLQALQLATHPDCGSRSQERKLARAWGRLCRPRWWHKYVG